jgi:hypothetical protein
VGDDPNFGRKTLGARPSDEEAERYSRRDDVAIVASERGLYVVESDDYHLQLDVDHLSDSREASKVYNWCVGVYGIENVLATQSMSGNLHLYVKLPMAEPADVRITLQAALGSDLIREELNRQRLEEGRAPEIVLFETAQELERVLAFLGRQK